MLELMSRWSDALLAVFYPPRCLHCNSLLADNEKYLCGQCLFDLPKMYYTDHEINMAMMRFDEHLRIERAASYCYYKSGSAFRDMIHQAKYYNRPEILFRLAQQVAHEWEDNGFFDGIDLIVPVPLHSDKLKQRGFNQVDYIADGLNSVLHLPIEYNALIRVHNNDSQTSQDISLRALNVQNAFVANSKFDFTGKHLLVVDDVLTTGATLTNCVKSLLNNRRVKVSVFTLGMSVK